MTMTDTIGRREFLKASAAFAGAAAAGVFACVEIASAAPIQARVVDKLTIRVLVDSSHDLFFRPNQAHGVSIQPAPRPPAFRRTLHHKGGLALYLQPPRGSEKRTIMLDYGYSPEALLNTIELVQADPGKVRALIVSHGHFGDWGGLM